METGRFRTGVARIVAAVAGLIVIAFIYESVQAHKAITSKYTYNEDVYPILRDRCGRCHVSGGAAPMSLLTYKEALPWAESIRQELAHQRMPPWYADGASSMSRYSLTARELDTLLTWATGGAPEGSPENRPEPATVKDEWPLGPPDLLIPMAEYTMPADQRDAVQDFVVPTGLRETRWLRAADLQPGTPALVRSATIVVDSSAAHGNHETVLKLWQPGELPPPVPGGVAFKLPADAHLRLQIRYKKPWYMHGAMSDRSVVGLYFAEQPAPGQELQALQFQAAPSGDAGTRRLACHVPGGIRVVAVLPALDQPYAAIDIQGLLPDGSRVRLINLAHPRPEWDRRYWLAHPVDLPEGAQLEATAIVEPLYSDVPLRAAAPMPELRLTVDFVSR